MTHTAHYTVKQDQTTLSRKPSLDDAITVAKSLFEALPQGSEASFTVENEDGYLLAVFTNRRMVGTFSKQKWGGRKGNDAIAIGDETFDATDAVLLMPHKDLQQLKDNSSRSDEIGQAHVSWHGPCSVQIADSICAFFGVDTFEEITTEALAFAKQQLAPKPAEEQTVTLSVKVKIRKAPGCEVQEFIENLDYSVVSNTTGIVVLDTEIAEAA